MIYHIFDKIYFHADCTYASAINRINTKIINYLRAWYILYDSITHLSDENFIIVLLIVVERAKHCK